LPVLQDQKKQRPLEPNKKNLKLGQSGRRRCPQARGASVSGSSKRMPRSGYLTERERFSWGFGSAKGARSPRAEIGHDLFLEDLIARPKLVSNGEPDASPDVQYSPVPKNETNQLTTPSSDCVSDQTARPSSLVRPRSVRSCRRARRASSRYLALLRGEPACRVPC
jgi:hypothetical protein